MKRRGSNRKTSALTLIETLVVVAVLALLVALLVAALLPPRRRASRINCINNLKQVGLSFRLWANDNGGKFPMQVSLTNGGTMELVQSGTVFPHFQVYVERTEYAENFGLPGRFGADLRHQLHIRLERLAYQLLRWRGCHV